MKMIKVFGEEIREVTQRTSVTARFRGQEMEKRREGFTLP